MGFVRTALLFALMTLLFVAVGWIAGSLFADDPVSGMGLFLVVALGLNLFSYFFSDKIVLRMYRARIVSPQEAPRLHVVVEQLAARMGVPKPRVAIIPSDTPNAFATGRGPRNAVVAATEGILRLLDERELGGVLALVAAVLAPVGAMLIQLGIGRSREFAADEEGAHAHGDPLALASALEKLETYNRARPMQRGSPTTASLFIVNPFKGLSFGSLFSTHPPTAERVRRLRRMAGLL